MHGVSRKMTMLRFGQYLLVTLIFVCSTVLAFEESLPPLDPEYMKTYDMILVSKGTTLYAYPIPGYEKPNNQQIIYKISTKNRSIRLLVRDADLVTARTTKFNLQRLMRNEELDITMDIYMGHYYRGGIKVHEEAVIAFDELLYYRTFDEIQPSSGQHIYDKVKVGTNEYILVHRLKEKPTYDNLILFDDMKSCITDFKTESPTPSMNEIFSRLTLCGPMKPMYYETDLFLYQ